MSEETLLELVPVGFGAGIGLVSALSVTWLTNCFARRRERKKLHREKLEEAIQGLLSLREWALTAAHDTRIMYVDVDKEGKPQLEHLIQTGKKIGIEGELIYERVLVLLETYSHIECVGKRLYDAFNPYRSAVEKWRAQGAESKSLEGERMNKTYEDFETACNKLIKEAKDKILKIYMP